MTWTDCSEENEGRECWRFEVGQGRGPDDWPGTSVVVGETATGPWKIRVELFVDGARLSDPIPDRATARAAADELVHALQRLWPTNGAP